MNNTKTEPALLPLVVDLDGTLSRTDTLHEALLRYVAAAPWKLPKLLFKAGEGKAAFKAYVADQVQPEPDSLVFDTRVQDRIAQARSEGRHVALVSASDKRVVKAVADHLGVFDEVLGTGDDKGQNLGGQAKADLLVNRFGHSGFDYIGDCSVDIPVWQAARTALSANPSAKLESKAAQNGITLIQINPRPDPVAAKLPYLRALRPHQWSKNLLIFLPLLTSQDVAQVGSAVLAFFLFCLVASSVYIINDLLDLPSDRAHPRKCARPFAAGDIPVAHGMAMAAGLLGISLLLAPLFLPPLFVSVLVGYFAVTLAYSIVLKRKLIVDIIVLAGLYTLRIIAGGAATQIVPSPWLLAFSGFLFYALATIKRQAELVDQIKRGKEASAGRAYFSGDMIIMQIIAISAGQAAVLVFALYIYSPAVAELYKRPEVLWLICPVMLYWLSRIAVLTHRGHMHDDPIVFAARDKISLLTALVVGAIMVLAEL